MPQTMIDWSLAANAAARLGLPGPRTSAQTAAAETAALHQAADDSIHHVHRLTRLDAAEDLRDSEVLVVDRATWAQAATESFDALTQPVMHRMAEQYPEQYEKASGALTAKLAGAQTGGVLAFLGSKVLGQYDPFCALPDVETGQPAGPSGGRLLLVAPNVLAVRNELHVRPEDFRLWVCLHEQTHRVQFAAAPWLRTYLQEQLAEMFATLFSGSEGESAEDAGSAGAQQTASATNAALKNSPALSRITAVMSLLEGHANVIMDAVDRDVVPTVKTIRRRFNQRSQHDSALTRALKSLLGMDEKAKQYSNGQSFVQKAVDHIGMDAFNAVWTSPEMLPTETELHDAEAWAARIG